MAKVLTALQPSGVLHLGNYFGAIEPAVTLQAQHDLTMFVVDYHAITVPQKPDELRRNILFATAAYLACGIDPKKTLLFQQSAVPQHAELAWILQCVARMGELERMTQFKDKAGAKAEKVSVGLFTYPVLMAADILLYDTQTVPVGADQKQHVELARDLAIRFNRDYGETFVVPEPSIRAEGARVMGLDDPTKKMSKSAASAKNYISLLDDEGAILKKVKAAVTDSGAAVRAGEGRPAMTNLLTIYSLVTRRSIKEIENDYLGKGYGDFKADLAEVITLWLKPLQAKIETYLEHEEELVKILDAGAQKARERAERRMKAVRERIGVAL
ncbi:tryptophan--tRNA ligase [Candidatus Uhrbacteria bacterium RIFCSPHIGHO2_01_FULL_63_20]|uniref:Tryptophan--tRNA ligase n=1 Tax=Candidatus Uhrbacteria bacterium RIFCSPHIGHO2_01_FULL_63_20 TaxID=1802385 RepID=A0A1F7TLU7_9BACT|nr:MAG: tryptophan--tRNA ligase [Candidatus Uhrbacteria bacterium RIFCSPHIGHO2_01_FULL_63_20]